MRKYEIVLMREDVALMYRGMEKKLFQLFKENRLATDLLKTITRSQINYITRTIPEKQINQAIYHTLFHNKDYSRVENVHHIDFKKDDSTATITVTHNKILLEADGNLDVETCFFEILRYYQHYFLALDYANNQYGWLRPLKTLDTVQK
ncbi:sporulation inhibitor of replication protein SirA [Salipaludibacillus sp. LMS25]|uniref:sporulation inhibitor of replication protein SirA n=1 Tax=Salipaludibacillus sp. LMS25 TaxID=2924031 RepID=UPI0020D02590|nr:sporulation inhibitor of replication protein SirA [Salipaludibacillus sp. LMS25]UTR14989.1 sporulation inhibitor of replication protein SirA [Salipaludibacillus sp. LMS25]